MKVFVLTYRPPIHLSVEQVSALTDYGRILPAYHRGNPCVSGSGNSFWENPYCLPQGQAGAGTGSGRILIVYHRGKRERGQVLGESLLSTTGARTT